MKLSAGLMKGLIFLAILMFSSIVIRCGTREGNGLVTVDFQSYSQSGSWFTFIKPAYAAVSSVTFCFKRLRFKTEGEQTSPDPEQDSDNIDLAIGEVTISPSGTTLGNVTVPPGTYKRVEFDLEDKCTSGKSIQVANSNGPFSTNDRIKIRFEGTFTMGQADRRLSLAVQTIISALNSVTSDSDIRSKAESSTGSFSD